MLLSKYARDHPEYSEKLQRVHEYISSFTNTTEQGGAAWKFMRAANFVDGQLIATVGGSEMATVIGKNPYRTVDDMIVEKVQFFTTGVAADRDDAQMLLRTEWGHICEPYSRQFICDLYDCDFYEIAASIVHVSEPRVRYSPDGVGVIRIQDAGNPSVPDRCMIALLELKNPYDRIAKTEIPKYYDPQVCTGMDVIAMTEIGVYAECNFRCQSLREFGKPVYNARIHFKSSINGKKGAARFENLQVHCSALAFFAVPLAGDKAIAATNDLAILSAACDDMSFTCGDVCESLQSTADGDCELIDFGASNEALLTLLTSQINKGHLRRFSTDRAEIIEDDDDRERIVAESFTEFFTWCRAENMRPYAVLPLSLFSYAICLRRKSPDYVACVKTYLDAYSARINDAVTRAGGFHKSFYRYHGETSRQLGETSQPQGDNN